MPLPVVVVASGGLPVYQSTTGGLPLEISVLPGALPVTIVISGGIPCLDPAGNVFTPAFSLTAPVLDWTTAASDNTPGFSVSGASLDIAPVGAKIEIQISTDVDFTPPPTDTELGDVTGNPVAIDVSPALADGTYWARARILSSADVALSDWSNVETETIETSRQFAMFSPIYSGIYMNASGSRQTTVGGAYLNEG